MLDRPVRKANLISGSRARLNPSAVFAPNSTAQVAASVKILEFFQRQFAVRGRGYTMLPGMSGIEDGVLIALENMKDISLSPSHEVVSLGPGNHWGRVYEALQAEGVAVPGGEMAVVGISGFLTGSRSRFFEFPFAAFPFPFRQSFSMLTDTPPQTE